MSSSILVIKGVLKGTFIWYCKRANNSSPGMCAHLFEYFIYSNLQKEFELVQGAEEGSISSIVYRQCIFG